jgi:uncharacterized protein YjbI with pentapeptide repeats
MTARSKLLRATGRLSEALRSLGSSRVRRLKRLKRREVAERLLELRQGLVSECRFVNRNVSRLDLGGLVAERITFVGCRMRRTSFDRSNLRDCHFIECDCRGLTAVAASWREVSFQSCDFSNSDLRSLLLTGDVSGVKLEGAFLNQARLDNVNLYGSVLCRADLRDASFTGAMLEAADFCGANLFNTVCRGAKAAHAVFERAVCIGADFRNADLTGACFDGSQARVADFRSATLTRASCQGADFGESDFSGADTSGASFESARLWLTVGLETPAKNAGP